MNTNTPVNPALENRDFTVIIDRSGSMGNPERAGKTRSRWNAAEEATVALARECNKYDPDGITVYAFSARFDRFDNTSEVQVSKIFQQLTPGGSTDLAGVLRDALLGKNGYVTRKRRGEAKANGELIVVVTDGEPDDQKAVADVIIEASHGLTSQSELNITFVQVGDDHKATQFLSNLDDKLEAPQGQQGSKNYAKFDIVDTITLDDMGSRNLADVLVAAVTEHKQSK
jgi:Mg-chelatase subunit ChlD